MQASGVVALSHEDSSWGALPERPQSARPATDRLGTAYGYPRAVGRLGTAKSIAAKIGEAAAHGEQFQ
jgi:hypothetical protein